MRTPQALWLEAETLEHLAGGISFAPDKAELLAEAERLRQSAAELPSQIEEAAPGADGSDGRAHGGGDHAKQQR